MTYSIRFLPEIEQDLVVGYKWYESKYAGLGEEFLRLFYAHASEISHNPLLFRKVYKDFRRRLMRRFPYVIYFQIDGSQIIVFGLFHSARDPRTIRKKLTKRE